MSHTCIARVRNQRFVAGDCVVNHLEQAWPLNAKTCSNSSEEVTMNVIYLAAGAGAGWIGADTLPVLCLGGGPGPIMLVLGPRC